MNEDADREEHRQLELAYWAGLSPQARQAWLDQAEKFVDGLQQSRKVRKDHPAADGEQP